MQSSTKNLVKGFCIAVGAHVTAISAKNANTITKLFAPGVKIGKILVLKPLKLAENCDDKLDHLRFYNSISHLKAIKSRKVLKEVTYLQKLLSQPQKTTRERRK